MSTKRIRPAIYHYYPRGPHKNHMSMREEEYKTEVTFLPQSLKDSIYVQLFDLKFEIPPSKIFLADAKMDEGDEMEVNTSVYVEGDRAIRLELYVMQYSDEERLSNKRFMLTLNPGVNPVVEVVKQMEDAKYFKMSYKYIVETLEPTTVRFDDLYVTFR
ncbi:hypothetical protein ACFO4U_07905 [Exiguobacterium profundum]|uniref:hypothetical protein n=2 Tax=Bacillales Family XII. Incertae Sedis TaxID=539742 RepID=UPI0012EF2AEC|nr:MULTISPECIES: hypothetical protein [Exiguobacterium]MCT4797728.1 hypothetical protein [Exiguobacterium profundum]VXB55267.1 conserved hypothetical protein [Exiguobacterium sp. 8A]VXB56312.1 conserved hypothetical protein [Exiguobacterium sp. 8H]